MTTFADVGMGWVKLGVGMMAVAALAVASCGSNDVNPNPLISHATVDGGADGSTSGGSSGTAAAGTTPGTSPTPVGSGQSRRDGGVDGLLAGATFTDLYNNVFLVSCGGGDCHNPGSHHGVNFFTQQNGYASLIGFVVPGDAGRSRLYQILANGSMPPNGPPLSPAELAMVASWIDAGALNN